MGEDEKSWLECPQSDRWIFDKLLLSSALGYTCGPAGVDVPKPAHYVVRPCVNLNGMSRGAYVTYLTGNTDDLPVGTFWCEQFEGDHVSVDYKNGEQVLAVQADIDPTGNLVKFRRWYQVHYDITLPGEIQYFVDKYPVVNVELIQNKVIEVHLRSNPDFRDNPIEVVPVWHDEKINVPDGFEFVEDRDHLRQGFYKRWN